MLESKDEKSEQRGSNKELEQMHQSMEPNASEITLPARQYRVADVSSEEVEAASKTDVAITNGISEFDQCRSSKEQEQLHQSLSGSKVGEVKPWAVSDCF